MWQSSRSPSEHPWQEDSWPQEIEFTEKADGALQKADIRSNDGMDANVWACSLMLQSGHVMSTFQFMQDTIRLAFIKPTSVAIPV
jgi:hypothetical protein